ncbi:glycoprotein hormone beta-5-like isoform X2 [Xyrauchen texanus]|uniref:glycoprotein hormone beta-5-like isoform X2 n=1 Tax=Xyrauchen texanus TaxID=154827 RepID=UPI0022427095|nr:glycoprotein hormone beta-5-like isoform X2 [Xyrauchen texanus]
MGSNRMCLDHLSMTAVTFLLLFAGFELTIAVTTLQSFRGCAVGDFNFVAQKPGCRSLLINTEACWGRCHTWEVTKICHIKEAGSGAAVYPKAPPCLHVQPHTPHDSPFTRLSP